MLGIICGLESEKKIAARIDGAIVVCSAARPDKARELAQELVAKGATRLMSFGIAGSLDSSVNLGDVFIGTRIESAGGHWQCDEAWGRALTEKIPQAKRGGVYGSESLIATVQDKENLFHKTGCAIVDMESQCAAEVAAASHLPMITVRAVCDDAKMNVPEFLMAAIDEEGKVNMPRAFWHLAKHPLQVPDLFKVGCGTSKALAALRAIRDSL